MKAGDVIAGRYRLESPIGEGGLGFVWAATQLDLDRRVAIKFIKASTTESVRRFEIEALAVARLAHPNCVATHEFGRTAQGEPFLVMEHVSGPTLASSNGQHRSIASILAIAEQLLAAIAHAHGAGVAHRDLKPENIILVPGPTGDTVKVLDFGLAKLSGQSTPDITKTGEVMGTVAYMSPEQLRGTRDAGAPSDIYSLGVILFELLEGRRPFSGNSMLAIGMAHLTEAAPAVSRGDTPEALRHLVAEMLRKRHEERPTATAAARRLSEPAVDRPAAALSVRTPNQRSSSLR